MGAASLSAVERIKAASRGLRGTIVESLADPLTGGIAEDDQHLLKFHGSYQQHDRDSAEARRHAKLEPAFSFMIRTRLPGGLCSPAQWLALDALATRYANGTLRLTSRQAFQLHGVVKGDLKPTPVLRMPGLDAALGFSAVLKCENLQPLGAFKVRGGVYFMSQLTEEERARVLALAAELGVN